MRTEVPVLQRCCFCLPLRRSLIGWGYFKLILCSILLPYYSLIIFTSSSISVDSDLVIFIIILVLLSTEVVLHTIFLVGAHKKNVRLLRIFCFYSIILLVLYSVVGIVNVGVIIYGMSSYKLHDYLDLPRLSMFASIFINWLSLAYIFLLVNSQIAKLNNANSFRFINNATQAERCTMLVEDENQAVQDQTHLQTENK